MGAGPEHLVAAGLPAMLERLGYHVSRHTVEPAAVSWRAEVRTAFELAAEIAGRVSAARAAGRFPLLLAGNCMAALGVVAGLGAGHRRPLARRARRFQHAGDHDWRLSRRHGDLGDHRPLLDRHAVNGPGVRARGRAGRLAIGARDFDSTEAEALLASPIRHVPVSDVNGALGDDARRELRTSQTYVHFDLDVLHPSEGRVNR